MKMLDELVTKIDQTMSNMDNRVRRKLDEPLMQWAPDVAQPPPPANARPAAHTPGAAQPPPSDNPWAPVQGTMAGYAKPNETPQDWINKFRHTLRWDSRPDLNAFGQDFGYEHELTNDDISDWPTVPNRFVCNPFDSVYSDFGGTLGVGVHVERRRDRLGDYCTDSEQSSPRMRWAPRRSPTTATKPG